MPDPKRAAFFDVDGTLVRTNIVHAFAFYAMNQGTHLRHRLAAPRARSPPCPSSGPLDKVNRKVFNELFYRVLRRAERGSPGRARRRALRGRAPAGGPPRHAPASSRRRGARAAGSCSSRARSTSPCGASRSTSARTTSSRTACASCEGFATGRVMPPIIEGAHKALVIRDYCVREGLALERELRLLRLFSDYPMLAVVGPPRRREPGRRLARVARAYEWPILGPPSVKHAHPMSLARFYEQTESDRHDRAATRRRACSSRARTSSSRTCPRARASSTRSRRSRRCRT